MPLFSGNIWDGKLVRNCQLNLGTPSRATSIKKIASTTMPSKVATNTVPTNNLSSRCRLETDVWSLPSPCCSSPFSRWVCAISVDLPVAPHDPVADEVEDQGHHEQCSADGEERLVHGRAACRLPARNLHDVRRHRQRPLQRVSGEPRLLARGDGHDH